MTTFNSRTQVITSYGSRDAVGRVYLSTESGEILTTEDGTWIIAIDRQDTIYITRPPILRGDSIPLISTGFWDDLLLWDDTKTWNDSLSLGTPYTSRIIP